MNTKYFSLIIILLMNTIAFGQLDEYSWLEEVDGTKALKFVEDKNATTFDALMKRPEYNELYTKALEVYNATDRIAYPAIVGNFIYNFWQDKEHPRGIWRRTTKEDYANANPKWETLIDIDELSTRDNEKYVYKGSSGLYPDYNRFLIFLSKGGGDATIVKEYDMTKKAFVNEGFDLLESKGGASYLDANTLIVQRNFGEGSMTTSGYPNQVKIWKRGTNMDDAKLIFEGQNTDVSSGGYIMRDGSKSYLMVYRGVTFYTRKYYLFEGEKIKSLDIPEDADVSGILDDQLMISLKSDWTVNNISYKTGSIISLDFTKLRNGIKEALLIYQPDANSSVNDVFTTKNHLLLNVLSNVKSELYNYSFKDGKWTNVKVKAPAFGTISPISSDDFSDDFYFDFQNFLIPPSLYFSNASTNEVKVVKSKSAYFNGEDFKVEQFFAKSKDGEMIPYFVVSGKETKLNGQNPTLLYAYGGFEVSMLPSYSGFIGKGWLEKGGVYVLANIRGGGEFGPRWHQAGLKEKRQNIYNDFYAVAEDLIQKKITAPKHLGIYGGSNGGLLVGVAFTQRPDLYNAVVCAVPLLDMKRYNHLLAGASWMGEYGDPDKEDEWTYLKNFSPYHNMKPNAKYPEVFFTTSTRDDRVHPGHARKMVAKMSDMGYKVYYYENTEGGHAGSSTNEQRAKSSALIYTYLSMKLK